MGRLTEHEERLLQRLDRTQPIAAVAGVLLAALGAAYLTWAVLHFDPRGDPTRDPGFDRPVARIAGLITPYKAIVDGIQTQTPLEARLVRGLSRSMTFSLGIVLLLVRTLFAAGMILTGFAAMTVVAERRRLLRIVGRLRS